MAGRRSPSPGTAGRLLADARLPVTPDPGQARQPGYARTCASASSSCVITDASWTSATSRSSPRKSSRQHANRRHRRHVMCSAGRRQANRHQTSRPRNVEIPCRLPPKVTASPRPRHRASAGTPAGPLGPRRPARWCRPGSPGRPGHRAVRPRRHLQAEGTRKLPSTLDSFRQCELYKKRIGHRPGDATAEVPGRVIGMTLSTREAGAAFADIVCADQQWVDAEFDALISACFGEPPAPAAARAAPGPAPPGHPVPALPAAFARPGCHRLPGHRAGPRPAAPAPGASSGRPRGRRPRSLSGRRPARQHSAPGRREGGPDNTPPNSTSGRRGSLPGARCTDSPAGFRKRVDADSPKRGSGWRLTECDGPSLLATLRSGSRSVRPGQG